MTKRFGCIDHRGQMDRSILNHIKGAGSGVRGNAPIMTPTPFRSRSSDLGFGHLLRRPILVHPADEPLDHFSGSAGNILLE